MAWHGSEEIELDSTGKVGGGVTIDTKEYGESRKSREMFSRARGDKTSLIVKIDCDLVCVLFSVGRWVSFGHEEHCDRI